ncbi:hypothetical protein G9A89_020995 [Geosiphon pyriformis]|nr:hypothetical protein G9A89_020995 [Geosiphon pyriformis]
MSNKKAPVGASSGSVGGPSSQKKRVSLHHMNQSGDRNKAVLAKPYSGGSQYSDMESDSGDSVAGSILAGSDDGSLLGLAATISKAKRVKNNLDCGFLLGSLDGGPLLPPLGIPLKKMWLDSKIVKSQVEVVVKKSFALDINLSAVEGKSVTAKTQLIKKLFSKINGFGGATTPSKFEEIIRLIFTSLESLKKAVSLAKENNIIVNSNLKRQKIHSDRAVVIKEISMDTPKEMIIAAVSEYGQIVSIKVQLIGLWQKAVVEFAKSSQADLLALKWSFLVGKNSVCVAKIVKNRETWAFRDQFRALLFILPVETTAHDLGNLLEGAGEKTCVINCLLETGNRTRCVVVCFESDKAMESAFYMEPIFGGVKLSWARLDLVRCEWCGKFSYSALECDAEVASVFQSPKSFKKPANLDTCLQLAKLYAKKRVPISSQVVSVASVSHGSLDGSGSGSLLFGALNSSGTPPPLSMVDAPLGVCLACLECSVELLSDQILNILLHFDNLSLVSLAPSSDIIPPVNTPQLSVSGSLMVANSNLDSNMVLDVLTSKVGVLESKLVALDASIADVCWFGFSGPLLISITSYIWKIATCNVRGMNNPAKQEDIICWHKEMNNMISIVTETKLKDGIHPWIMNKFVGVRVFTSGLSSGYMSSGVAIIMNNFLARHVCKVLDISGRFLSVKLLFKNKLSVSILGLYAGSSLAVHFSQVDDINSLIARAVNESSFIILGGDFNEDGSCKSASLKKCFDLGLVNSLSGSLFEKDATWNNSRGVAKVINYVFVSSNLVNAILDCDVSGVKEYFDTDHKAVSVSVGFGGLLDYNFVNAGDANWIKFKEDTSVNAAKICLDLDTMWSHLHQVMCLSAENVFKKKWFKSFNSVYNRVLFRFHKLELLVLKIVKASRLVSHEEFVSLLNTWKGIDTANASVVESLFLSGSHFDAICSALARIRKSYRSSKLSESNHAKESQIKLAIDKRMEGFKLNKILDHLVMGDELVLDPAPVKSKMDEIMEGWTRKQRVVLDVNDKWSHQYCSLGYVFDEAFSGVIGVINFDELFEVVSNLPDGKAAGLLDISNELWKHCDISVLNMLLVLLNSCLFEESVSGPWKEAWGVLTNTCLIALIETARKILSKILSDKISSACSTHDVLCDDNFSVLKDIITQSPIFAVGLVVEDDMRKAYDSVGWKHLKKCLVRIKICDKFIQFFGGIHRGHTNRVMTNFGLTDGYYVHDVKHQESVCEYRLISYFVSKSGHVELQAGLSSYFAAGAFFFRINDISINNDKTVVIPINCKVGNSTLFISGSPISVAKKGESHQYLGIFLSTESLSKPSLAKAHSDVHFFTNLVLKKAISDKQFLYLVSAVLQPIISYRTQFSFVPIGICNKWDAIIHKGLKLKSGLLLNFPSDLIHHPSFYGLKSFLQIQSEGKVASFINFANSGEIVGRLFSHRSHDLQVLCWHPIHPLSSSVRICVSTSNNFLADVVCVLYNCKLSLGGSFPNSFHANSGTPMSTVLGESVFSRCLPLLQWYGVAFVDQLRDRYGTVFDWSTFKRWKKLDPHGPIPEWFRLSAVFLAGKNSSPARVLLLANIGPLNILGSSGFVSVCDCLLQVNTRVLLVYTNGSLRNLGTVGCEAGAVAFFEDIGMGLGVGMSGLMSSTMAELQAIALALECVPVFSVVHLFSDSQSALDACKLELGLVVPDFRNRCWVECQHIANVIYSKDLRVNWHKVKGHSGILGNEHADVIASAVSVSDWFLPPRLDEHFLMADGNVVSGNSRHFVCDTFRAMCHAHWEVGSGSKFLPVNLCADVDWSHSSLVWHPNLHMTTSFTSKISANAHSYFIKALHHRLPVAVRKWLYNRLYPSVLCLYCGDVKVSDHVFSCKIDDSAWRRLLDSHMNSWETLSGSSVSFSVLLQLLSSCVLGSSFSEAVSVFYNPKVACLEVINFACSLDLAFRNEIWLVQAKHHAYMEKHGLIPLDGSSPISVSGLTSRLSAGVVDLLGIDEALGVHFGFRKSCMFFSSIGDSASVYIAV